MAGRFHGRFGRVYVGVTSAAEASPLPFVAEWTYAASTDKVDVTALGDTSKVVVAGLPDSSGTATGFMDDASASLYTAASDGLARKTYLYPNLNVSGSYWFGTAFWDSEYSGSVGDAGKFSGSFAAATSFSRVG